MGKKYKRLKRKYIAHKHSKAKQFLQLKNHPFVIPVVTFLVLFFVTLAGFVNMGGTTVGASDSRIVHVTIDGERQQTVPTRAPNVRELLKRLGIEVDENDVIEPGLDTQIYDDDFRVNIYRARPVAIIDEDGKRTTVLSAYQEARTIVQQAGVHIYAEDNVTLTRSDEVLRDRFVGREVIIDRSSPVLINLYGTPIQVRTHATTVRALLEEKGIEPSGDDQVQPGLDTALSASTVVTISRMGVQIASEEKAIDPPVENVSDPNLAYGTTVVRQSGRPGKKVVTYEIELRNGQEVGRKVLQEVIVERPVKRVVAVGSRSVFADYNADGIPARVFCGSPRQRNWKNINVANAAIGRSLAAARGWTGGEWDALLELFACESSWIETAGNPFSGAYGIPQSLPASKMASAGSDYITNPRTQIIWGLDYIARVYGSPSRALSKHYAVNWY